MDRGVVTGVQRSSKACTVTLLGGPTITAAYLGFPPCPRSIVAVERFGNGSWLVLGQIGDRRQILHDDFLYMDASRYGDTQWTGVGTLGAIGGNSTSDAQGVARLTTNAVAFQWGGFTKTNQNITLPSSDGLWVSGKLNVSATTSMGALVGLANSTSYDFSAIAAGDACVALYWDTGGTLTWKMRTTNGASSNDTDTGVPVTTFNVDFDIVVVGGSWAAIWVNGIGPFKSTTNIPPANTTPSPQPAFSVIPIAASSRVLEVDWFHLERCSGVTAP